MLREPVICEVSYSTEKWVLEGLVIFQKLTNCHQVKVISGVPDGIF